MNLSNLLDKLGAMQVTSVIKPVTVCENKPNVTRVSELKPTAPIAGEKKTLASKWEARVAKTKKQKEIQEFQSNLIELKLEMGPKSVVTRHPGGKRRIKLDSIEWIVVRDNITFRAPELIKCGVDVYPAIYDKAIQLYRWYLATDKAKVKALLHDLLWALVERDETECGNYYPERCDPWQIDESGRLSRKQDGVRYWFDWKDDLFILSDSQGHISTYKDPGEAVEAYGNLTIHHSGSPSS